MIKAVNVSKGVPSSLCPWSGWFLGVNRVCRLCFFLRYFFAVLAILTLLGILNGLVLLPVLLSVMGPPAEVATAHNGNCLSSPSPELTPPTMNHHGYYAGHIPRGRRQAFSEVSDSEYYSETTTTSGIGEEDYKHCDKSAYITASTLPPTSHILLEASKNPTFPKLTVSILHRCIASVMAHYFWLFLLAVFPHTYNIGGHAVFDFTCFALKAGATLTVLTT